MMEIAVAIAARQKGWNIRATGRASSVVLWRSFASAFVVSENPLPVLEALEGREILEILEIPEGGREIGVREWKHEREEGKSVEEGRERGLDRGGWRDP